MTQIGKKNLSIKFGKLMHTQTENTERTGSNTQNGTHDFFIQRDTNRNETIYEDYTMFWKLDRSSMIFFSPLKQLIKFSD